MKGMGLIQCRRETLAVGLLSFAGWIPFASAQPELLPVVSVDGLRGRVVYPQQVKIDPDEIDRILMIVDTERVTDGFPSTYALDRSVTVSLALALDRRVDARALLPGAVIILPIERFGEWNDSKLRRIIRHELAHIAVGDFMGPHFRDIPRWFDEGFAEWTAGGLRPEGRVLVEIEVRRRTRAGEPMPVLADALQDLPQRMAHDFFASFFEFLEVTRALSRTDGELLRNIKRHGMSKGFKKTFDATLEELEEAWHQWLSAGILSEPSTRKK